MPFLNIAAPCDQTLLRNHHPTVQAFLETIAGEELCRSQDRLRKEEDLRPWRSLHEISPPALHAINVIENYACSVVPDNQGPHRRWETEAGCEKSAFRTCSSPSANQRSSTTTAGEDRRNDDEDTPVSNVVATLSERRR
ncbi:unnamed protein product [Soboliphyme baturini]|uniref:Uncharacterized protein n=1 Tax=Soboliphyme baturini TaxID=241478 RepID=A0A183J3Y9_9BILA|nr:unnamed protein product [Soboliphyme baturini]